MGKVKYIPQFIKPGLSLGILTDYKGFFESKQKTAIYRGGMDINRIISHFKEFDYDVFAIPITKIKIILFILFFY